MKIFKLLTWTLGHCSFLNYYGLINKIYGRYVIRIYPMFTVKEKENVACPVLCVVTGNT